MTRRLPTPLPWLAGLLALYLLAPFLAGIPQLWTASWQSVDLPALGRACAVSVASATLASVLIALGGIPLGYVLARVPGRAMRVLGFLVQLPLALPPLASGVLLLFLLGRRSPLGRLAAGGLTDSFAGIVLAETFVAAPFLIIAARSAFRAVDPALEGVAATLGHGRLATFLRVSLPLAWPTTRSGLLLAWLRGFGEFGATIMVAYHPYSLPVYTYVAFGSQGLSAMLPVLVPALAAAFVVMGLSGAGTGARRARAPVQPLEAAIGEQRRRTQPLPDKALVFRLRRQLDAFQLDVAWQVNARRLAILGPSGSGKSLTLRLLAGLERPEAGVLRFGDRDLGASPPELRSIAYVPQNYCLFPHLTVAEHVQFPIGADPEVAHRWLLRLGLTRLTARRPAELSLGQQQRVALARALVRPAELLLLDEPFSALDTPLRRRLQRELRELQQEIDMTTLIVTHDAAEALLLADQLLVLDDGRVLQTGAVQAVLRRPASEAVARLLGAEDVSDALVVAEDRIGIGGGMELTVAGPALRPGERVGWSVRADHLRLCASGRYPAMIEAIATVGIGREITLRLGAAVVRLQAGAGDPAREGPCRVDIDPGSVQLWPL